MEGWGECNRGKGKFFQEIIRLIFSAYMRTFPKLEQRSRRLFRLIRLWLVSGLLALCGMHFLFSTTSHAAEVGEGIFENQLVDGNVTNALKLLRVEVQKTRVKLNPGLTNEFEAALRDRLKGIQADANGHIVKEYKSATIAKRLLELSEHVFTLSNRSIPANPQERTKAREQYAAAVDRFEKGLDARLGNERWGGLGMFGHVLSATQSDLFRPGFGKALNDREVAELNRILDRVLDEAAAVMKLEKRKRLPESSKVSRDGMREVMKFLSERDALENNSSFRKAFMTWREGIAAIEQPIDRELKRTTEIEIAAVMERTRQQAEKDLRENDPANIDRERRLKELREKGPEIPAPKVL